MIPPYASEEEQRKGGRVGKPTGLSQVEPQEGLAPTGFDPSRIDWSCGSASVPAPLLEADAWCDRLHKGGQERVAAAKEIEQAAEAFRADPIGEGWERQARIHCLNYAMRSIKNTDPLFGEGGPFGLPWGLICGRARLDAIECFKLSLRDSDGSPKGGDACGSVADDSAAPSGDRP